MTRNQLLQLIGENSLYTLHSHTQYCDGRASMEEFAKEAAQRGFAVYGFTPHSPLPVESTCNMSKDSVPLYLTEVKRLQEAYPSVRFLAGMEIDYINNEWGASNDYFLSLPLDFTISSVHFIPNQEGEYVDIDGRFESFKRKMHEKFHDDLRYVVDTFFSHSQAMLAAGHFDIIGHFDKIKHNGSLFISGLEKTDWYNRQVNDLIDTIISKDIIVEINTKAWNENKQLFPDQRHWRRLLEAKIPIVINSDAHYPARINDSRPEVAKALDYVRNHLS